MGMKITIHNFTFADLTWIKRVQTIKNTYSIKVCKKYFTTEVLKMLERVTKKQFQNICA